MSSRNYIASRLRGKKFKNKHEFNIFVALCKKEFEEKKSSQEDCLNFPFPITIQANNTLFFNILKDQALFFRLLEQKTTKGFAWKRDRAESIVRSRSTSYSKEDIYHEFEMLFPGEDVHDYLQLEKQMEVSFMFPHWKVCRSVKPHDKIFFENHLLSSENKGSCIGKIGFRMRLVGFYSKTNPVFPLTNLRKTDHLENGDHYLGSSLPFLPSGVEHINYTEGQNWTEIEQMFLNEDNLLIALVMRSVRLSNPYPENSTLSTYFKQQSQFNIPILMMTAGWCYRPSKKPGFVLRDCFFLKNYFEMLYPDQPSSFLNTSRIALWSGDHITNDYIMDQLQQVDFVVDLHGTGSSFYHFMDKNQYHKPLLFFNQEVNNIERNKESLIFYDPSVAWRIRDHIEKLNPSPFGTFLGCGDDPIHIKRGVLEFSAPFLSCVMLAHLQAFETIQLLRPLNLSIKFSRTATEHIYEKAETVFLRQLPEFQTKHDPNQFYFQPDHIHFISYGTANMREQAVLYENLYSNIFASAEVYSPSKLVGLPGYKEELYNKTYTGQFLHPEHNRGRTHSFWRWKPFVILHHLSRMKDGEILVYQDLNTFKYPYLTAESTPDMPNLVQKLMDHHSVFDIFVFMETDPHLLLKNFCRKDAFEKLQVCPNRFGSFPLIQGNRILVRKTATSMELLSRWLHHCLDDGLLLPSSNPPETFSPGGWHTHDQALLELTLCQSLTNQSSIPIVRSRNKRFVEEDLVYETLHF